MSQCAKHDSYIRLDKVRTMLIVVPLFIAGTEITVYEKSFHKLVIKGQWD